MRRVALFDEILNKVSPLLDAKFGDIIKEVRAVNANVNKLREELKQKGVL